MNANGEYVGISPHRTHAHPPRTTPGPLCAGAAPTLTHPCDHAHSHTRARHDDRPRCQRPTTPSPSAWQHRSGLAWISSSRRVAALDKSRSARTPFQAGHHTCSAHRPHAWRMESRVIQSKDAGTCGTYQRLWTSLRVFEGRSECSSGLDIGPDTHLRMASIRQATSPTPPPMTPSRAAAYRTSGAPKARTHPLYPTAPILLQPNEVSHISPPHIYVVM
ncbi:hypothetical protein C8R43DRAFT_345442 [Mycena crocata]|nr:hypothetical protein C8R43DRAFT_345442 [Mycena crocata]